MPPPLFYVFSPKLFSILGPWLSRPLTVLVPARGPSPSGVCQSPFNQLPLPEGIGAWLLGGRSRPVGSHQSWRRSTPVQAMLPNNLCPADETTSPHYAQVLLTGRQAAESAVQGPVI